ncbi:MAG: hypothetical protein LBU12_07205 [Deltaproteobacteria bacterium]|jgi:spermidine synthase|nr:hypothetical protein [Deltaproteobacteria bacterium]
MTWPNSQAELAPAAPEKSGEPKILFEGDSPFHRVTVLERDGFRMLCLGQRLSSPQTRVSIADLEASDVEYPGLMLLSLAVGRKNRRILMLGLGGGFIPGLFKRHLSEHLLTVVEIDPLVAELAETFFGFSAGGNVELVIADGLDHISALPAESCDQIWLDAYDGSGVSPLASIGFFDLVRSKLVEGGLLTQNLLVFPEDLLVRQLADVKAVFGHDPLLFLARHGGNAVAMNLNAQDGLPRAKGELVEAVKAFGTDVGPYDLLSEVNKLASRYFYDRWLLHGDESPL